MFNEAFVGTLPLSGTDVAVRWNHLYNFVLWLSVFFFILVVGGMIYFLFAYRHKSGQKTEYIKGNHLLELVWVGVPTLLLLFIFGWGYHVYRSMTQAPPDAYEVRVIGKQWLWTFQYEDGRSTVSEVYVPMNRPVRFVMTSEDVLHGFFVPNFRVKQDVVPGMYSSIWFTATVPGKHQVFCTEYCGTSHSSMLAKIIVLDDEQWKMWTRNMPPENIPDARPPAEEGDVSPSQDGPHLVTQISTLAQQGQKTFREKGCLACHNVEDSSVKVGPSMKGLYESKVELADGKVVVADENFIRAHIENPQENSVKGFSSVMMPTFKGLISENEMNALMSYIKSLK